ncbi:MAG: glycosyltransferase family 4 protein [Clostridia bacterium]|nr:glycosyltransferase family 4 protein [Clostridia bacterium]
MKILVVSQYFYPEPFRINTICQELVQRGHDVTVMTAYPQYPKGEIYDGYGFDVPYDKEWNGVKIHRVKTHPRGHNALGLLRNCVSYVVSGNRWVKQCKEKYDRVFVFGLSPATLALPAVQYKKKFGTPMYYYLQDLWPESVHEVLGIRLAPLTFVINKIVGKIYKASDKILCTSKGYVKNLVDKGVPADKPVYWPQFCTEPDFTDTDKPAEYSADTFNVVFTGNIGDAQGLDLVVEAAARLKGKGIRWYLVGDGRAKERLEQLVADRGVQEDVIFVGRVSEAQANRYVHFADCAYLSFQPNPLFDLILPAKLQTYLACGAPILAAAGGESAALIAEAGCGMAVPPQVEELVQAVQTMAALTPEERREMANNARRYSAEHFDKDALIEELLDLMK